MTGDTAAGVQGVLGRIEPGSLGQTQCHEHLSLDVTVNGQRFLFDDLDLVGGELRAVGASGLRTIVDVGTDQHGRSPDFLRELARGTGVQVVASTGFWREAFYPQFLADESLPEVAQHLIDDITMGILGTDVRAGVIGEIGTEVGEITPLQEKAFHACAIAALETGVGIATHTAEGAQAIAQLDLLCNLGVDPGRLLVGHVDCLDDLEMHSEIARRGAFVGYDRVGNLAYQSDEVRSRLVLEMLDRGHVDHLILSLDLATERRMRSHGLPGYAYLLDVFVPRLRAEGVDEDSLWRILVNNPCRLLTGVEASRAA